ncbi:HD domain-containing phosphohydrolase [Magnetofaba australis]|uniref:Putative response regulator containing a CheY-like receiver domain and an HD-GYP n=1 Tax=Magnetofaba australis IT-1 TaxID=1434232 RepID=A0A1Y2K7R0_9PROT|nr:HD domain-containing phosphohydrolase [Magnetofaba australis]OSM05377.1 putative response regulator containing a CheY-like receiver domain and an HD-GYP [Magnetofaba australis IT-1]
MPNRPILVVDDEPINLAALRGILSPNYPLICVETGAAALHCARESAPSLILLDIQLPDRDGYAVCAELKQDADTESIPVIFVSSLKDVGDESKGFAVGGVDYIVKPLSPEIVLARVATHLSLVRSQALQKSCQEAITMLAQAGHYNDTDTGAHIWRMAGFSEALAKAAGWSAEQAEQLRLAAPMHDMGKIGIPDAILKAPRKLTAEEWVVMRTHSQIGHQILSESSSGVFKLAAEIALNHHEKWDGSGYPNGLAGEAIPQSARIVAIADVFDALTMARPYKNAWPIEQVVQQIRSEAGTHFDPDLAARFLEIVPQLLSIKAFWDAREQPALH